MSITTEFILKLFFSLFLGACIGMERQWRQRMAGLRTNMLVSLGAAMFVSLSVNIGGDAVGRVISYVVSGIGFLGAGVIMKTGMNIRGLNTAATLWCSASIGTFCGAGYFKEAAIGCLFIVLTHLLMRPLGVQLSRISTRKKNSSHTDYLISIKCKEKIETDIRGSLIQYISEENKLFLRSLTSFNEHNSLTVTINAEIVSSSSKDLEIEKITNKITSDKNVSQVSWEIVGEQNDL